MRVTDWLGLSSVDAEPATKQDKARGAVLGLVPALAAVVATSLLHVHGLVSFVVWVGVGALAGTIWWPLVLWVWPPSRGRA